MTATVNRAVPAGNSPRAPRHSASEGNTLRRRAWFDRSVMPYLLLAPAVLGIVFLLGYPAVLVFITSFQKLDLAELFSGETVWVGFDNYVEIFSEADFWTITLRTVVFTAVVVGGTVLAALGISLLLKHVPGKIRMILQICLLLAWATPILASTTVYLWIFDQNFGILNKTLVRIGFDSFAGFNWFQSGLSTLAVIGLLIAWQAVPFVALTLYAGLLGVPTDLYEAAGIDGASPWQAFWAVTWPGVRPILALATFLSAIWDFKVFTQVYAIRKGGPNGDSTTLSILQYLKGQSGSHYGLGAAVSVIMILILAVACTQYLRMLIKSSDVELR
ncbi:sugar ABC transporter permease [Pseudonocardiaceae bacterium YIM PH 21723]|nr:sugar ABC transporter permease [Pseudonocardiaceae bacterium YIM PH 21723]